MVKEKVCFKSSGCRLCVCLSVILSVFVLLGGIFSPVHAVTEGDYCSSGGECDCDGAKKVICITPFLYIWVNCEGAGCDSEQCGTVNCNFVRTLPSCYSPGNKFTVTLNATPSPIASSYVIEETVPAGWTISNVSDVGLGSWSTNRISFLFFDKNSRTLTYDVTPPVTESGDKTFIGTALENSGVSKDITGQNTISYCQPISVVRTLPSCYDDEIKFTVTLNATPASTADRYTIEETVPAGWTISNINEMGMGSFNSAANKITFFFTDNISRTLTYDVTPPAEEAGDKTFIGTALAKGVQKETGGQSVISRCPYVERILPSCYQAGKPFTVTLNVPFIDAIEETPPDGWTVSNVSANGEISGSNKITFFLMFSSISTLTYDVTPPATETGDGIFRGIAWGNGISKNIKGQSVIIKCPDSFVTRTLPDCYIPGNSFTVTLNAAPPSTATSYWIEETVPAGWTVSNISDLGMGIWGPNKIIFMYIDNASRTLTYDITPAATETGDKIFTGKSGTLEYGEKDITGESLISGCHIVSISGYVTDDYSLERGISDVMLILSNGGGSVTTDISGFYSISVPSGWSGEVMPSLKGCNFMPASQFFSNLSSDQKLNFIGTCKVATAFTVSGMIWNINGTGVSDVTLKSDKGETATSDIFGFYSMTVSSGWSGTVTPYKSDCIFTPASQYFGSMMWNQWQDFTADCGEPPAWITRTFPAAYMPGAKFTVTLKAVPPSGTNMYSVEDKCMNGWTVDVSEGIFDTNTGKVKFGPFQDGKARTLTYSVTPPSSEIKDGTFDGTGIINSEARVVGGQSVISKGLETHPADMNTDFSMSIVEMNSYGSAWLNFAPWTLPPNPIPMSYVSKAVELWQNGETYKYDPSVGSPPKCWVNTSSGRSAREDTPLTAARDLPSLYKAGTAITVTISVSASATGYTVEETLPSGWTASDMSDGGTTGGGFVRFLIPAAGGQAKTLTYQATPPSDAKGLYTFGGKISYSGNTPRTIAGDGAVSDTLPGDLNGDLKADLKDAVIALQIVAATQPPPTAAAGADVNNDGKIGTEEAIFALEKAAVAAELR